MELSSVAQRVEHLVLVLSRNTPTELGQAAYDDLLSELFELLFDEEGLSAVADLKTIQGVKQILLENGVDRSYPERLTRLEQHRAQMSDVHAKLATNPRHDCGHPRRALSHA